MWVHKKKNHKKKNLRKKILGERVGTSQAFFYTKVRIKTKPSPNSQTLLLPRPFQFISTPTPPFPPFFSRFPSLPPPPLPHFSPSWWLVRSCSPWPPMETCYHRRSSLLPLLILKNLVLFIDRFLFCLVVSFLMHFFFFFFFAIFLFLSPCFLSFLFFFFFSFLPILIVYPLQKKKAISQGGLQDNAEVLEDFALVLLEVGEFQEAGELLQRFSFFFSTH